MVSAGSVYTHVTEIKIIIIIIIISGIQGYTSSDYIPVCAMAVLTSLHPQMNIKVLTSLFLDVCSSLCP